MQYAFTRRRLTPNSRAVPVARLGLQARRHPPQLPWDSSIHPAGTSERPRAGVAPRRWQMNNPGECHGNGGGRPTRAKPEAGSRFELISGPVQFTGSPLRASGESMPFRRCRGLQPAVTLAPRAGVECQDSSDTNHWCPSVATPVRCELHSSAAARCKRNGLRPFGHQPQCANAVRVAAGRCEVSLKWNGEECAERAPEAGNVSGPRTARADESASRSRARSL